MSNIFYIENYGYIKDEKSLINFINSSETNDPSINTYEVVINSTKIDKNKFKYVISAYCYDIHSFFKNHINKKDYINYILTNILNNQLYSKNENKLKFYNINPNFLDSEIIFEYDENELINYLIKDKELNKLIQDLHNRINQENSYEKSYLNKFKRDIKTLFLNIHLDYNYECYIGVKWSEEVRFDKLFKELLELYSKYFSDYEIIQFGCPRINPEYKD